MNVKLPLGVALLLAIAVGYLLGTEAGRERRDDLMRRAGRGDAADDLIDDIAAVVD